MAPNHRAGFVARVAPTMRLEGVVMKAVAGCQNKLLVSHTDRQFAGKNKGALFAGVRSQLLPRRRRLKDDIVDREFVIPRCGRE